MQYHARLCKTKMSWFVCMFLLQVPQSHGLSYLVLKCVEMGWLRHAETLWLNGWPLGRRGRLQQYYPQLQPGRANRSKGVYGKEMSDMQDLHRSPSWHVSGRGWERLRISMSCLWCSMPNQACHSRPFTCSVGSEMQKAGSVEDRLPEILEGWQVVWVWASEDVKDCEGLKVH